MATVVNTVISTAIEAPSPPSSAMPSYSSSNTTEQNANGSPRRMKKKTKYRHVFATHSQKRESCLTHGAQQSPSFVGFRNLMILVLVFSNLRLMIENFRKVHGPEK